VGRRRSIRGGGRPGSRPIVLREPELVPMSEHEREVAISSLAQLLRSWLEDGRNMPWEGRGGSDDTGPR